MSVNGGVMQILEATTQAAPKMTEALSNYGDGRMGDGILKFMDWSWREGKTEGRIEGAVVAGVITGLVGLSSTLYMYHKLKQEAKHGRDVMNDLLDEMTENHGRHNHADVGDKPAQVNTTDDADVEDLAKPILAQQ